MQPSIDPPIYLAVNLGYAFYVKLRVIVATTAASQYARAQGQSLTSGTLTTFATNVQSVATMTAGFKVAPTVTVLVNNASGATNVNNF